MVEVTPRLRLHVLEELLAAPAVRMLGDLAQPRVPRLLGGAAARGNAHGQLAGFLYGAQGVAALAAMR